MRLAAIFAVACILGIVGCQKPLASNATADATSFQKPTATEVFNLRSKCAELGEKILDANTIGRALTQAQVSHYDPTTNRCYVELTVQDANLSNDADFFKALYDGQTRQMLATVNKKKGKYGMVFDNQHHSPIPVPYDATVLWLDALAYIDEKMADDRKE